MWSLASFVIKKNDKHTFVVRHGLQRNDRSLGKKLQQQDAALLKEIWPFYQKGYPLKFTYSEEKSLHETVIKLRGKIHIGYC